MWTLLFPILAGSVSASCECGYRTNTGEVWQSRILTNFTSAVNSSQGFDANWVVTNRVQGAVTNSTPYQINYTTGNVIFPSSGSSSPRLTLIASGYAGEVDGAIRSAQIETLRDDILYGSFRAAYAVNGPSGACSGFFSYADDSNENDVEVLTQDGPDEIHFTNQPADDGGVTAAMYMPNNLLTTNEQEYRFDWTAQGVKYYINDIFMTNLTQHPSGEASQILMNAWSNGGSFTSGPPMADVQVAVRFMHLYFNTSSTTVAQEYQSACAAAGGSAVCDADAGSAAITGNGGTVINDTSSAASPATSSSTRLVTSSSSRSSVLDSTHSRSLLVLAVLTTTALAFGRFL